MILHKLPNKHRIKLIGKIKENPDLTRVEHREQLWVYFKEIYEHVKKIPIKIANEKNS